MSIKIICFIFLFCVITCEDNANITSNVQEIETSQDFINVLANKNYTSVVIYIFSPQCPHCFQFSPKYDHISNLYKDNDKIKFIKISSVHYEIFEKYFYIESFPKVVLYNQKLFLMYSGLNEVDEVSDFISTKSNYQCTEIDSLERFDNFITENILFSYQKEKSYIFGVFEDVPSKKEKMIENFNRLHALNKDILREKQCYYFFYSNPNEKTAFGKQINNKEILQFFLNTNEDKNFIFSYNYQKGINSFTFFNNEMLEDQNIFKEIKGLYRKFLLKNIFPFYQKYNDIDLYELFSRNSKFLIFSYENETQYNYFELIIKAYLTSNYYDSKYIVILIDVPKQIEKSQAGIPSYLQYFLFGKEVGIYLTDKKFRSAMKIQDPEDIEHTPFEERFTYTNLIELIKDDMEREAESKKQTSNDLNGFVTAKVVEPQDNKTEQEKLIEENSHKTEEEHNDMLIEKTDLNNNTNQDDSIDNKTESNEENKFLNIGHNKKEEVKAEFEIEDEIINKKIIMIPIYLIVYSIIFFYLYKTKLYQYFQDGKENDTKSS